MHVMIRKFILLYWKRKGIRLEKHLQCGARIGQGKHQKAWEQEIRREHNSNPLQCHSHVYFFAGSFSRPIPLYTHVECCGHDCLWWIAIDVPNTLLSTGMHSPPMSSDVTCMSEKKAALPKPLILDLELLAQSFPNLLHHSLHYVWHTGMQQNLNEHADYKRACPGHLRPEATGKCENGKRWICLSLAKDTLDSIMHIFYILTLFFWYSFFCSLTR